MKGKKCSNVFRMIIDVPAINCHMVKIWLIIRRTDIENIQNFRIS